MKRNKIYAFALALVALTSTLSAHELTIRAAEELNLLRTDEGPKLAAKPDENLFPHLIIKEVVEKRAKKCHRTVMVGNQGKNPYEFVKGMNKGNNDFQIVAKTLKGADPLELYADSRLSFDSKKQEYTLTLADETTRLYKRVGERSKKKIDDVRDSDFTYYKLTWERLPNGRYITYDYDTFCRVTKITTTNPEKTKTYAKAEFAYSGKPFKETTLKVTASDGRTIHYNYTKKRGVRYLHDVKVVQAGSKNTIYTPNDIKSLASKKTTSQANVKYEYNKDGCPIKRIDGHEIEVYTLRKKNPGIDMPEVIEKRIFSPHLKKEIPLSRTTLTYNNDLRIIGEETTKLDRKGNAVTHHATHYDNEGNTLESIQWINGTKAVTRYTYDGKNRLSSITDPVGRKTQIAYLEKGKIKTTDSEGNTHLRTPNDQGVVILEQTWGKEGELLLEKRYGNKGQILRENDTTYTYDNNGCMRSKTLPDGRVINYNYDKKGRLNALSSSDGSVSYALTYDAGDRIIRAKNLISGETAIRRYNNKGLLEKETFTTGWAVKKLYDCQGRLKRLILPNSTPVVYGYDTHFMRSVSRQDGQGNLLYTHNYTDYDLAGNLLKEEHIFKLGVTKHNYNLLSGEVERKTTFGVENDRELPAQEIDGTFDALGRLIAFSSGTHDHRLSYDYWGRCVSEEIIEKSSGRSQVEYRLYDGEHEVVRVSNGEIKAIRVLGLHGEPVAIESRGMTFLPLQAINGTPVALLDVENGGLIETYTYSPEKGVEIKNRRGQPLLRSAVGNPWQ